MSPSSEPGFGTLQSLLRRRIFFDYFVNVAQRRYAGKNSEPKVRKLIEDSRRFYRVVLLADLLLTGVVTVLIIGLSAAAAVKALSPLPWPWPQM